ncbi:hypothetical protein ACTM9E_22960 [Citrobacter freundii]
MQKVLLVAVAILFALGVLTSYQKHILDYRVSAITEIEFGQASAIEHREYLLRSCQSGAWVGTKLLDKNIVTGNTTCSSTAMSVATCPSGKTIASGGWRLTWYGSGNNAPDSSYPRNTTQWVTNSNGDNNCFQSVAMCE